MYCIAKVPSTALVDGAHFVPTSPSFIFAQVDRVSLCKLIHVRTVQADHVREP